MLVLYLLLLLLGFLHILLGARGDLVTSSAHAH